MARRLPPLNGLKAFEAAARSESFTRAAEELNVTQGAISHQVKALEDSLGVKLFHRERQRLILTEAGRDYLAAAARERCSHRQHLAGLCRQMVGQPAEPLCRETSERRFACLGNDALRRFRSRGCRCRDPTWRRELAGAAHGAALFGAAFSGV